MRQIVGWGVMSGDETCEECFKNEATLYVSDDGCDMHPACKECIKDIPTEQDRIAQTLKKAFKPPKK